MKKPLSQLALVISLGALSLTTSADNHEPIPLIFVIHDDVPDLKLGGLKREYIDWFVEELKQISGRDFDISFIENARGYNDFDYKSANSKDSIDEWTTRVWQLMHEEYGSSNLSPKYLLITGEDINSTDGGIAYLRGSAAIASISSYRNIAHEVGHMFGATHENAEVRWKGVWKCESNVYWGRDGSRANCYEYSQNNREAIANYIDRNY